jgi:hypothetical protein
VGWNAPDSTITDSYATGTVTGKEGEEASEGVGGLVGWNQGTITNSYATGTVTGTKKAKNLGGLVGWNQGTITKSYATGTVSATTLVGGLVGLNGGTISSSYWDKDKSGMNLSAGGEGKTTEEMKQQGTYADWDFKDIWSIDGIRNNGYPFLKDNPPNEPDIDAVFAARDALTWDSIKGENSAPNNITTDLVNPLPTAGTNGTVISWSADPAKWINTTTGEVTRPTSVQGNQTVSLTATIIKGAVSAAKSFTLTIIAEPAATYTLTITASTGGSITTDNSGNYTAGTVITITATAASGYSFNRWTSTGGGTFANANNASTTYTMPANATTITATFTYNNSGGGSPGGGSSGGSSGRNSTPSGTRVTSSGGTFSQDGVTLTFPAGTVESDILVQLKEAGLSTGMTLPDGSKLLSRIMNIIKNKSGNFLKPVTITLSFNKSEFNPDEYYIAIYYYDEDAGKWVALDNIRLNLDTGTISGDTTHFTKFAVIATPKTKKPSKSVTPQPTVNVPSDISGHWAKDSVMKMINTRVISGYPDGTFKPNKAVTRAEFTVMLVKALNLETRAGKTFTDTASHWAKESIATAAAHGIISGYDENTFGPDDLITREQAAIIITRAAKLEAATNELNFTDRKAISPWAKPGVAAAVKAGFITGYPDNSFRPQGHTTRAEAAVMIGRLIKGN